MTESDLKKRPEFGNLPIFDESDEVGCQSLLRPLDPNYDGAIAEAEDAFQFMNLLDDVNFEIKGAIKYSNSDVRGIFWKKRTHRS